MKIADISRAAEFNAALESNQRWLKESWQTNDDEVTLSVQPRYSDESAVRCRVPLAFIRAAVSEYIKHLQEELKKLGVEV